MPGGALEVSWFASVFIFFGGDGSASTCASELDVLTVILADVDAAKSGPFVSSSRVRLPRVLEVAPCALVACSPDAGGGVRDPTTRKGD